MSTITTYTKKSIDPTNPDIRLVDICDIAHSLSLLCRANGHFKSFYSVASHSVNCALEAKARGYSKRIQLACLLHDASESYLSDITRPVKKALPQYLEIEKCMQDCIWKKFFKSPLSEDELKKVFEIDDAMLYYEFLVLMGEMQQAKEEPFIASRPDFSFVNFEKTEEEFLKLFHRLQGEPLTVGVDWKSGKWLAAELFGNSLSFSEFPDIESLCSAYEDADAIIIDIPIGLPENSEEAFLRPDKEARDYLVTARKSTLFNVPFRPVIYAESTKEAWDINHVLCGKLTPQGMALCKIIRQVDAFLQENPKWKNKLLESHPEVVFQSLNGDSGLIHSKHTPEGLTERANILKRYSVILPETAFKNDDMLDAASLALIGRLGINGGFVTIPKIPVCDKTGLKMQITLANI